MLTRNGAKVIAYLVLILTAPIGLLGFTAGLMGGVFEPGLAAVAFSSIGGILLLSALPARYFESRPEPALELGDAERGIPEDTGSAAAFEESGDRPAESSSLLLNLNSLSEAATEVRECMICSRELREGVVSKFPKIYSRIGTDRFGMDAYYQEMVYSSEGGYLVDSFIGWMCYDCTYEKTGYGPSQGALYAMGEDSKFIFNSFMTHY